MLGMAIGSLTGGVVMKIGRRRTMILTSILGMIGVSFTYRLNFT